MFVSDVFWWHNLEMVARKDRNPSNNFKTQCQPYLLIPNAMQGELRKY